MTQQKIIHGVLVVLVILGLGVIIAVLDRFVHGVLR